MIKFENVEVTCYSGYKLHDRPRQFILQGKEHNIIDITSRWYEASTDSTKPQVECFRVKTDKRKEYILKYNGISDSWSIMVL